MKFLYKIYSNFDGFTPKQITARMLRAKYLKLGWSRYLDELDVGAECWIYFHGRHAFTPGVYVKGFVAKIDRNQRFVLLRVREHSETQPLTDEVTSRRVADRVNTKYRQVFLWPDAWDTVPQCGRDSCLKRLCDNCDTWRGLRIIEVEELKDCSAVTATAVVPAYWIIPNRCYLYTEHHEPATWTRRVSLIFGEFKLGERRYAYPLARGIFEALRQRGLMEFDAIIPVPLSPDKEQAGELHRTRVLASELGLLLGVPVREYLELTVPVSKRRMLATGHTLSEFRDKYYAALRVDSKVSALKHAILLDDVMTRGATASCATRRLVEAHPALRLVVASAGQMIIKAAVRSESGFVNEAFV
jgi:predicted amidophosphoribosyltransferase